MSTKNTSFFCDGKLEDIVNNFNYLGIVFSAGCSFSDQQNTTAGHACKILLV